MVHDGGALLAFVCGVVYTLLQSIISYKSCPQWNSLSTCHVRLAISAISCAAVVPSILCIFVSVFTGLTVLPLPQKSMKQKQRLTGGCPHASEEQLGEKYTLLRKYLNIVRLDQNNLWGESVCKKDGNLPQHFSLFTFFPTGKVS